MPQSPFGFQAIPGAGAYPSAPPNSRSVSGGPSPFTPRTSTGGGGGYNPAYGGKPAALGLPPSLWQQTQTSVPGITGLTNSATGVVGDELGGFLSQATKDALANASSAWGVKNFGSGSRIPGSAVGNFDLQSLGINTEAQRHQGLTDYDQLLHSVASLQLDPSLISGTEQYNAMVAAAPEPYAAAMEKERLMNKYFEKLYNLTAPGGGPSGGTGVYRPQIVPNQALLGSGYAPGIGGVGGSIARDIQNPGATSTSAGSIYGGRYYEGTPNFGGLPPGMGASNTGYGVSSDNLVNPNFDEDWANIYGDWNRLPNFGA